MELDDETRGQLGYATERGSIDAREEGLREWQGRFVLTPDSITPAPPRLDGRHRRRDREAMSRAYWERKRRKAS